jgi:hypothetical protein
LLRFELLLVGLLEWGEMNILRPALDEQIIIISQTVWINRVDGWVPFEVILS